MTAATKGNQPMTFDQFLATYRITMHAERIDARTDMPADTRDAEWDRTARHWCCVLMTTVDQRRRMTVYFSQGSAHTDEPTAADVLDCLAMDAAGLENAPGFEEWAREYGYDTDSRKAEAVYKTVQKQAAKLARFLSPEAYDALLWHTERG
jgi:hypothetical protein